jgi:hypothetical protein
MLKLLVANRIDSHAWTTGQEKAGQNADGDSHRDFMSIAWLNLLSFHISGFLLGYLEVPLTRTEKPGRM